MSSLSFSIRHESVTDSASVESLIQTIFGPSQLTRAAYALREGVPHEVDLSFVAEVNSKIVGTVRLTKIKWGGEPIYMLGPLGVLRKHKGEGVGKALMNAAIKAAKKQNELPLIMLVGDHPYYAPFGFKPVPTGKITLPRPANPARILVCELRPGALSKFRGAAQRFNE